MSFSPERLQCLRQINERLRLDKKDDKPYSKNIIFVYCPPKVGSTTLVSSLRLFAAEKFTICHIHDEVMLQVLAHMQKDICVNDIILYNKHIGKNVYVIDIYRTPIERKISEFFEKISVYHFNNTEEKISKYPLPIITKRFNNLFPHLSVGDHYLEKYDIPNPSAFDFTKKYIDQQVKGIHYIKLRLSDTAHWGNILTTLLKTEIKIINDYETEKKTIGVLYKKFKEQYRIPQNFLQDITQCRYLNFFYSPQEKEAYLNTWRSKTTGSWVAYSKHEYHIYKDIYWENKYLNDLQTYHYIDAGCLCNMCQAKRLTMREKIKRGEKPIGFIYHEMLKTQQQIRNNKPIKIAKKTNFRVTMSVKQPMSTRDINGLFI